LVDTVTSPVPEVSSEPDPADRTAEYVKRTTDLEGRLNSLKRKTTIAMGQAKKAAALSLKVSLLEDQVSTLTVKIVHLEECDLYMTEVIEAASEQLQCKLLGVPEYFCRNFCLNWPYSCSPSICLDPIPEDRRVNKRATALDRVSSDTNTCWADSCRCSAVVLLQDRTQHIGEVVDGCQKSLTTMFSVMLPRNPLSENFGQLLEVFKTSQRIHRLIELNLVDGAKFALGWVRKWHSKLNFNTIS
jgi:hypothetical protein